MLSLQPAALVEKYVRRGLLTRIAAELPDRMPDFGLITLQGEEPSPAALAFRDVIRTLADQEAETA
jgi:DNA-binding transcriptional LysR family regulator